MDRRELLKTTLTAGAALGLGAVSTRRAVGAPARTFQLKYAPHFGMFKHHAGEDLIDQLSSLDLTEPSDLETTLPLREGSE